MGFGAETHGLCFGKVGGDVQNEFCEVRWEGCVGDDVVQTAFEYVLFGRLDVMFSESTCD